MNADKLKEICPKCGRHLYKKIIFCGSPRIVKVMCKCESDRWREEQQKEDATERQIELKRKISNSLMDKKFAASTFDNWDFNKGSRQMYMLGKKYAANFKECKNKGLGLLVYGEPGNGKTYLASAIANELLKQYVTVICVSINALLERIQETYNKWGNEAESNVIKSLYNADLLIIDDLGVEKGSDWSRSIIYNIIDSRYRSNLPLIITSNLNINLNQQYGILEERYSKRTESRILEMCVPILNRSKSIRLDEAKKKTEKLKKILYGGMEK